MCHVKFQLKIWCWYTTNDADDVFWFHSNAKDVEFCFNMNRTDWWWYGTLSLSLSHSNFITSPIVIIAIVYILMFISKLGWKTIIIIIPTEHIVQRGFKYGIFAVLCKYWDTKYTRKAKRWKSGLMSLCIYIFIYV